MQSVEKDQLKRSMLLIIKFEYASRMNTSERLIICFVKSKDAKEIVSWPLKAHEIFIIDMSYIVFSCLLHLLMFPLAVTNSAIFMYNATYPGQSSLYVHFCADLTMQHYLLPTFDRLISTGLLSKCRSSSKTFFKICFRLIKKGGENKSQLHWTQITSIT